MSPEAIPAFIGEYEWMLLHMHADKITMPGIRESMRKEDCRHKVDFGRLMDLIEVTPQDCRVGAKAGIGEIYWMTAIT